MFNFGILIVAMEHEIKETFAFVNKSKAFISLWGPGEIIGLIGVDFPDDIYSHLHFAEVQGV